jgi:hypothetical protein
MDQLESNWSFQEIFMDIEMEEDEELPDYAMSFSGEDCNGSILFWAVFLQRRRH